MNPKKKLTFAALILLAGVLSACGGASAPSQSSDVTPDQSATTATESETKTSEESVPSETSETEEPVSSETESESGEVESSETVPVSSSGDLDPWVNYAEDLYCKLKLDYKDRSFWTDGIEKVTLHATIDGDTAHFMTSTGAILKSRFYGIDTPESTGAVQPYGKQASKYTSETLVEASEKGTIVVSSAQDDYGLPNADSTGSRYVSLIWVNPTEKNAPFDRLMLLNLMVVEYGYSWVKSVNSMPDFAPIFYAAENQAKAYKLKLHSGEKDPYYNYGDYEDVSLLDIKQEVVAYLKDNKE